MAYNLLQEEWIPLRGPGGMRWADPVSVMLAAEGERIGWGRADFAGVTHEFLIGLLSVALMPADDAEWRHRLDQPFQADDLRAALQPLAGAFDLDGDGPRYMQDAGAVENGREAPIAALLIDAPGENALTRNLDVFVKRDSVRAACPRCAAAALHTMQTYAPSGGQGHRTGLRGGGPLTTLVVPGGPLWRTLWANVLPRRGGTDSDPIKSADPFAPGPIFPWMGAIRLSEAEGSETAPHQAPWLQSFFGLPRRIWLDFSGDGGRCGLCGEDSPVLVRRWFTRPRGVNYTGGWAHALSPYGLEPGKPETLAARKGSPTGPDWRDWLGLVEAPLDPAKGKGRIRRPAPAVAHFRRACRGREARLWAFGYDNDNMKARGWNDAEMPLLPAPLDEAARVQLIGVIESLTAGGDEALQSLTLALKRARSTRPADVKGDFTAERSTFLSLCRDGFEHALRTLTDRTLAGEALGISATEPVRRAFLTVLTQAAFRVYDRATDILPVELADLRQESDLSKRAGPVTGRIILRNAFAGQKSKIRAALNLPQAPAAKKPASPRRKTEGA